jgi:hypothetical protein
VPYLELKNRLLAQPYGPCILNINCLNEWTEGSYLEPETIHGRQYLEAVKQLFGSDPAVGAPPPAQSQTR